MVARGEEVDAAVVFEEDEEEEEAEEDKTEALPDEEYRRRNLSLASSHALRPIEEAVSERRWIWSSRTTGRDRKDREAEEEEEAEE